MNIDDIWIGDEVMVKSSRVRGWFQGKGNSGLFKIKSADGKILEVNAEEIALIGHPTKSDKNTGGIKFRKSWKAIQQKIHHSEFGV